MATPAIKPAEDEGHSYSSTQVNLPNELADKVLEFAAKIPDAALAEDGREANPHITILYGLHTDMPADITKNLRGEGPIKAKIGAVSLFRGNGYDVLKLDVHSPDLRRINAKLRKALPYTSDFPKYSPHVTIAYLKNGKGKQYAGRMIPGLSGKTATFSSVTFSPAEGKKTQIQLQSKSVQLRQELTPDSFMASRTPAPPRKEVVQPKPSEQSAERAGAPKGEVNVNRGDQGLQQPSAEGGGTGGARGPVATPEHAVPVRGLPEEGGRPPGGGEPQPTAGDQGRAAGVRGAAAGGGAQTEDIITGTKDPSLTERGKKDAKGAARLVKNIKQIFVTQKSRGCQTADEFKGKGVTITGEDALGPWNLGKFQGQRQSAVNDQIDDFIANHPDEAVPDGESFNTYKDRPIGFVQSQVKKWKPGQRVLDITHSIGIHTLQAWIANGAPQDKSIDVQAMLNRKHMRPVALFRINPRNMTMREVRTSGPDGIYVMRHADTPLDNLPKGGTRK